MAKIYFKETQRYNNWLVLSMLVAVGLTAITNGIRLLLISEPQFFRAFSLLLIAVLMGGLVRWLKSLKLSVALSKKGVKCKLSPIQDKKLLIRWKDIVKCEIVKTSEAAQWSGGNITHYHEKRFSVTGRNGLAIKTKAGRHFFVGFNDLSGLKNALGNLQLS